MSNVLKDYVESLSEEERLMIVADFEQFENEGDIGDCFLRTSAEKVLNACGFTETPYLVSRVVSFMQYIAMETYRTFAAPTIQIALRNKDLKD